VLVAVISVDRRTFGLADAIVRWWYDDEESASRSLARSVTGGAGLDTTVGSDRAAVRRQCRSCCSTTATRRS